MMTTWKIQKQSRKIFFVERMNFCIVLSSLILNFNFNRKALASEDPLQLSDVLMSLVSICNYPNPHQALKSKM